MQNAKLFRRIPIEWLLLIIIASLVVIIGIFQWNQTKPIYQNSGQDTSGVILSETKGSPDGGGTNKRLEKEEGNVTVLVEYLPEKSADETVFQIALDTHSVNLDAFDFQKDVRLEKNDKSNYPIMINQEGSVHHRKALIYFEKASVPFEVAVMNLSGIPRREFVFTNL